ncbi:hypothetical protein DITRI_Ditri19aG0121900 [Diplodiscus trichospermus]
MDFGNKAGERAKEVEVRVQELDRELRKLNEELRNKALKAAIVKVGFVHKMLELINILMHQAGKFKMPLLEISLALTPVGFA